MKAWRRRGGLGTAVLGAPLDVVGFSPDPGSMFVEWAWPGNDPDEFLLSYDFEGTGFEVWTAVPGNTRDFSDLPPQGIGSYVVRVQAVANGVIGLPGDSLEFEV
jgi:hypothetical protein